MLAASASYPREFGVAVANLLPPRGARPELEVNVVLHGYPALDNDFGALDDLLKGSKKTWWRKYTSA